MKHPIYEILLPASLLTLAIWPNMLNAGSPPNTTQSDAFFNTAGGTGALGANNTSASYSNTAFGFRPLANNTSGNRNSAFGSEALTSNSSGSGNTAVGLWSMLKNTVGNFNTASGAGTLGNNISGLSNSASGGWSLFNNIGGNYNTANGFEALYNNLSGAANTALGYRSLYSEQSGSYNVALGTHALVKMQSGSSNLALGVKAGGNLISGNRNIYLGNPGLPIESDSIHIGNTNHTRTFISGIRGKSTGLKNAVLVVIDSNGQLGTVNSSERFKKDIRDMAGASQNLLKLRPVTYRYKQPAESGQEPLEYGLIAEEVAKIYPDLVAYGADGKIETVQYQKLTPMLLNELQKQAVIIKQQQAEIASLKTQTKVMEDLKQQVSALKAQVADFKALSARLAKIEAQQMVGWNK